MAGYTLQTIVGAPRQDVFDVFADRERWNEFLPLRVRLLEAGTFERTGAGAVFRLGVGPIGAVREQITEFVPGETISYRVVGGAPVRSHVGTIILSDVPGGTSVSYSMETTPAVRLPGALVSAGLRIAITVMVRRVRRVATRGR